MDSSIEAVLEEIVHRWQPETHLLDIKQITSDASPRRYFRLKLSNSSVSVMAMVFDSVSSPEVGGLTSVAADTAYVELTGFFFAHGISVPKLLFDAREQSVLLIEDCGDRHLVDLLGIRSMARVAEKEITAAYSKALQQIIRIQSVPKRSGFFPFERSFTESQYLNEMLELRDYTLAPLGVPTEDMLLYEDCCKDLAGQLDRLPRVLAHRDFHSWNLLVDSQEEVRVIDFQDALLATRCYDLVGLLNDRDTDVALGSLQYDALLHTFFQMVGEPEWFFREYYRVLLQRDLKVAGRFAKLSAARGLRQYERWIPGTLHRIGRTLEVLISEDESTSFRTMFTVLQNWVPEVKKVFEI